MKNKMVIVLLGVIALSVGLLGCGKTTVPTDANAPKTNSGGSATAAAPGGGQFNSAAFEQYRTDHKNGFEMSAKVGNIAKLEKDGKAKLTAVQAKKILEVLKPYRTVQDINEDAAKDIYRQLSTLLDGDQNAEVAALPQPGSRGAGGAKAGGGAGGATGGGQGRTRGGGQGAPGAGGAQGTPAAGGSGANRPPMDLEHFNPFYVKPDAPADAPPNRFDELFKGLESKAKGG